MTDLPATLEAVRVLSAPSREVADDVLRCFGWERVSSDLWRGPDGKLRLGDGPDPTASVDASKAMMPEEYAVQINLFEGGKCYVTFWPLGDPMNTREETAFNEATARTAAALAAEIERTK